MREKRQTDKCFFSSEYEREEGTQRETVRLSQEEPDSSAPCRNDPNHSRGFPIGGRAVVFALTSKNSPLGSTLNFDADVKKMTVRHQC